jgi:hypothetical protein
VDRVYTINVWAFLAFSRRTVKHCLVLLLYSWLSTYILRIDPQRPKSEKYRVTKRDMDAGRFLLLISLLSSLSMAENQPAEQHQREDLNAWEPKAADKSDALFSLYLERADDDDNKVTERWKKECDAILIFVGTLTDSHSNTATTLILNRVDRSFLGSPRSASCCFCLGPSAESTGYLSNLRHKHLSNTR